MLHSPRLWPEYHAGYYGVFLRNLDGNTVEAVHHTPLAELGVRVGPGSPWHRPEKPSRPYPGTPHRVTVGW